MRESIVQKINSKVSFHLHEEEINYIVKNWLELHSQHRVSNISTLATGTNFIEVALDKDSIYKSHI